MSTSQSLLVPWPRGCGKVAMWPHDHWPFGYSITWPFDHMAIWPVKTNTMLLISATLFRYGHKGWSKSCAHTAEDGTRSSVLHIWWCFTRLQYVCTDAPPQVRHTRPSSSLPSSRTTSTLARIKAVRHAKQERLIISFLPYIRRDTSKPTI